MGLKSITDESSSGAAFSRDILRVEICGPDEEHLTIIDVPGKFVHILNPDSSSNLSIHQASLKTPKKVCTRIPPFTQHNTF